MRTLLLLLFSFAMLYVAYTVDVNSVFYLGSIKGQGQQKSITVKYQSIFIERLIQWKPLNVITDNVIIRLMWSDWPSTMPLVVKYNINNSLIVISTSDIVITLKYFSYTKPEKLGLKHQNFKNQEQTKIF